MAGAPLVIDACSSLNLFASGRPVEIVQAAGAHLIVLPEVAAEVTYILGEPGEDGQRGHEPIDWNLLTGPELATFHPLPDGALPTFVEMAAQLTDTVARCIALVIHLRVGLLSDDGKVRRVFSTSAESAHLWSTVSLVRTAAKALPLDRMAIRSLFIRIRERARFEPPSRDPDHDWYAVQMGSE